ncbi:FtsX-like permease family protein [Azospirillum thermophilum]|uniref:ABC transporter permease n=1 Tax=Azospirillum thermophilum TaxID=2202148 RepID=A0A2S2CV42_9PROT|nr:FtsX-like permease family protein [Azospirillum thermophilum]AWK88346.1 ABC transporter permease [Azospirillum thermophilum]
MNPWPVVAADLRKGWAGALAVVLLVALAVALGVAVSAQERALRKGSARAADRFDLVVGAPGSPTQLVLTTVYLQPSPLRLVDGSLLSRLQADPGVELAAPIAFGDSHGRYPVVGTTAAFLALSGSPAEGRLFAAATEAVVGADVELPLGARFKPRHGQGHAAEDDDDDDAHEDGDHHDPAVHQELEYQVVGRLPRQGSPWDRAILVPVEAVWWLHGLPTGHAADRGRSGPPSGLVVGDRFDDPAPAGVPALVVKPKSVGDAYRLRGLLNAPGQGGQPVTMAVFPAEVLVELYATLGDARALVSVIAVATQVLVVAAVLLAVFATLATRRRPLAVLRALGASRGYVFAAVWLQVTLLVAAGGIAGLGLGWLGALAFSEVLRARTGLALPVALGSGEVAMVAALVLAGGLLALVPAAWSYRQPVAAGLRA